MTKTASFFILALMVLACDRNHKPIIADLTCTPAGGSAGTTFTLKVLASDEDGDIITYLWTADDGNFTTLVNSREVKWRSPVTGGGKIFSVSVKVSDGEKETIRSYPIQLGEALLGSVSGVVNFTNFKIPVPEVSISIAGKNTTTDPDGHFFIAGIPAISDTLYAGKPSFSSVKSVVNIPANDTLAVVLELTSVNFSTKVYGTVKDQDGLPLDSAKVVVLNPDGTPSKLKAITDESGSFRLLYIPFGERTIIASKEETTEASYAQLTKPVNLNDLQIQLSLVLQKTSFSGSFTDLRDQHVYTYKKIGSQFWMTQNLAYLPEVSPPDMLSTREPNYYVYGYEGTDTAAANDTDRYRLFGVLYNWPAEKAACPTGWHVPSMYEWDNLFYFLEPGAARKMKSSTDWNGRGGGSNSSGLNVFPSGQLKIDETFAASGDAAYFWSSTGGAYTQPGFRSLRFDSNELTTNQGSEKMGCSIRCVRNN
ncbi:MAG: FISUMP domain-containing protein [Bacteroidales bacterium]|jgi:uncharacterized protein (TIGR02145 family)